MKNLYLFFAATILTFTANTQNFNEVNPSPFVDIGRGKSVMADVDNDGHLDIIIAGNSYENSTQTDTVIVYRNDGTGNYTEITGNSFLGVYRPAFDIADIDDDGDIDILITGANNGSLTAKLYINDGTGIFTEVVTTIFEAVENGTVNFADVDNDGDQDVLLTGRNNNATSISKLYINNGSGNFTENTGSPFTGVRNGVVEFADINGNGSLDLLINGELYINDGNGNFSLQTPANLTYFGYGDAAFEDIDNDGDLDLIITGSMPNQIQPIYTKLYLNDGTGVFTEITGTLFTNLRYSSVDFIDFNGDSYPDLLIGGVDTNGDKHATFFINDGSGNFTIAPQQPIEAFSNGSLSIGDVDGDLDKDVLITGLYEKPSVFGGTVTARITRLYKLCNLELDQPTLNPISAICSLDEPQAPTATDNCS
ncbi:hypothetical protein CW751_15065, partial [Brumimicrobium salinarum]